MILLHDKHGTEVFDSALACVKWQVERGEYDAFDPYEKNHGARARQAIEEGNEAAALQIMREREDYEYESFEEK